jgi:ubiquitin-protein ligase
MTDKARTRICNELKQLSQRPVPGVSIATVGDDPFKLEGTIIGPAGSFYDGGVFKFTILAPPNYPFTEPLVIILTPIYHPGVGDKDDDKGRVCMEGMLGKAWAPTLGLRHSLDGLPALLADPNRSTNPLRPDLATELRADPDKFARVAREHTRQHAH